MLFIIRAAFWIAVVAAFAPAGFTAPEDGAFAREARAILSTPAREAAEAASGTGEMAASGLCADHGELCAVGRSLASFAGAMTELAADRTRSALDARAEERLTSEAEARRIEAAFARAAGEPHG
ncbi:hypothetical protein F1654_01215 [Alkalicaulis satelles]|uniref:UrcA family protein n=1 Tax=Alkalicaulis satelles TaxID=2609175 RepID=A0A5M6ZL17_9PROT|nr:hypothetical protein [Alkalicaulis satelles]KAA5804655.1 hypothetical protein F1654_01215 [Alkalicaulis satelles]